MTIQEKITKAEARYFAEHVEEPNIIIMRPEIRAELSYELYKAWEFDLNTYYGMTVAVCVADNFPDFKLGRVWQEH